MSRVYVGNLDPRVTERDLEDEFRMYGVLRSVWVARRPPGYAFLEFDDRRDALDAIQALDGVIVRVGDLPDAVVYHQFEVVETLLHIAMHVVDLLMPMGTEAKT
ncbi:hypothetical protein TIFTF001_010871 [Ficus carica]|uniref:RRM domain-containing protein n=1 Tax=Ficus carica TaxID=3494 RepID=A0AA87ZXP4_FICCA|nr:hypothetical protein TIFTF001_010871 [Ficus carica]